MNLKNIPFCTPQNLPFLNPMSPEMCWFGLLFVRGLGFGLGGWVWFFFILVVESMGFFILNNRLCKSFSSLLYLEYSYINCFPHTSSSSSPCWRIESQEISAIEKRLNWVWVLCSIAHPLPLRNSFSNCCHVWSKWHPCFHLGFFLPCVFCPWDNISSLLFRPFVICSRIKMTMLDVVLPFHPFFWEKKKPNSLTWVKQISLVELEWVSMSLHYAQLNSFPECCFFF